MVKKISALVKCKIGESLVESVVSILVFTILMVGISGMIATALRLTGNATINYKQIRTIMNEHVKGEYVTSAPAIITFTANVNGTVMESTVSAIETKEENVVAFIPYR